MSFSANEMIALREAFDMYDKDNDGYISAYDMQATMRSLGYRSSQSDIQRIFKRLDSNGDDAISFTEFVDFCSSKQRDHDPDKELRDAFRVFDCNNNGTICRDELYKCLKKIGVDIEEKDMDSIMRAVGVPPNGEIDFEAFKKFMT